MLNETIRTNGLFLGLTGQYQDYFVRPGSAGRVRLSESTWNRPNDKLPLQFLAEQGITTQSFLRTMLAQARATKPVMLNDLRPGVTDVRIHRVAFSQTTKALHVKSRVRL